MKHQNYHQGELIKKVLSTPAYTIAKQPVVINQEQPITKALSFFDKGLRSLLVVDSENKAIGLLESKNVLRSRIQPTSRVRTFMKPLVKISPETTIIESAREMLNSSVKALLIYDQSQPSTIKILTEEDVLRSAEEFFKTIRVSNIMVRGVVVEKPSTPLGIIINLMRERNIAHIPILENSKLVGVVSAKDIVEKLNRPEKKQRLGELAGEKEHLLKIPVEAVMSKNPQVLRSDNNLALAMRLMLDNKISSIIITDNIGSKNEIILGIITRHDILALIASQGLSQELGITMVGDFEKLDVFEKRFMEKELHRFMNKVKKMFTNPKIIVHLKAIKYHADKNSQLFNIRLKLYTPMGLLVVHHEGFGALTMLQTALEKLLTKVIKYKTLIHKERKQEFKP